MNNIFTVEESNLICIFMGKGKADVIKDIERAMPYLEDEDMKELSCRVMDKLQGMTDEEFARLELIVIE